MSHESKCGCVSNRKLMIEKSRRRKMVLSLLLCILPTTVWSGGRVETGGELPILEIGQEDGSYIEFANRGFRDLDEFHCSTEQITSADTFPLGHFILGVVTDRGVSRVVFDLTLVT